MSEGNTFRSTRAALLYLQKIGYKIQKSQIYRDVTAGRLRVRANGTVDRADVDLYARRFLAACRPGPGRKGTGRAVEESAEQARKDRAVADLREIQAAREARKFEIERAALMPVADHEKALDLRRRFFAGEVEDFIPRLAFAIIEACHGDKMKAPKVLDMLMAEARRWPDAWNLDAPFAAMVGTRFPQ